MNNIYMEIDKDTLWCQYMGSEVSIESYQKYLDQHPELSAREVIADDLTMLWQTDTSMYDKDYLRDEQIINIADAICRKWFDK